jgi:hypothetical protein
MEFPNDENINEDINNFYNQGNYDQGFGGGDEVQIESMEFSNNKYQNPNDNFNRSQSQNANFGNMPWENSPVNDMNYGQTIDDGMGETERKMIEERKSEEEQRKAKIMKKMNDELRIKQEWRDKAEDYIENWRR